MNIETKLREGSEAIKRATRQAAFSSRSPAQKREVLNGPMLALVGGVVVVALLAIPAMLVGVGGQPNGGVVGGTSPMADDQPPPTEAQPPPAESDEVTTTIGFAEDEVAKAVDAPDNFPFLFIRSSGWTPTYAHAVPPAANDGGFAAEINYKYMTEDDTGGVITLRLQEDGRAFERFAELQSISASPESLTINGREMTLQHVPREAIPEDADSDAYLAAWVESSSVQGFGIAFGLDRQELIDALEGLEPMPAEAWQELATVHSPSYQASTIPTTTTVGEGTDAP